MIIRHRSNQKYTLRKFYKDGFSLAVFKNGRLFYHSREKNLRPLVKYISFYGWKQTGLVIYDKYIGRAAALLFVGLRPRRIFTPIISKAAIPILKKANVKYSAKNIVPHLMGIASKGTCKWEKLSIGHTTSTFWRLVKKLIIR